MTYHTYLITGGTGFIGRELCSRLARDGAQLTVLSRRGNDAIKRLPRSTRIISSIQELTAGDSFDVVINLAGESIAGARWTKKRKQKIESSRIALTEELVDWMSAARSKPEVFLSASAIGFYGDQGDSMVTEASEPVPDYAHELCARWEASALRAEACGVRTVIPRIGLVVGRNGGFLKQMAMPFWFGAGGPIGSGKQWMSWIHLEDLIGMFEFLIHSPETRGQFNATAPNPVTNEEFSRTLGRVIRRPALLPAPAVAFKLAFGEMASLLLTGQRVLPLKAVDAGFLFRFSDLEEALRAVYR